MPNRRYRANLTPTEIKRIRDRYADGVSQEDIARQFGVHTGTISSHTQDMPRSNWASFARPKSRDKYLRRAARPLPTT